ncbi:MAG: ester cyclase [Gammaproteobacteria bacterium]
MTFQSWRTVMSLDQNKALSRKAIELWSSGDTTIVDQLFAADYVNHQHNHPNSPQVVRGIQAWEKFVTEFHEAFPDFLDTIEDQVAEGDKVATRFTSRGTQKGEIMGIAPTDRQASWTGITIDRIENGKIAETWGLVDTLGMLQQLRATPDSKPDAMPSQ